MMADKVYGSPSCRMIRTPDAQNNQETSPATDEGRAYQSLSGGLFGSFSRAVHTPSYSSQTPPGYRQRASALEGELGGRENSLEGSRSGRPGDLFDSSTWKQPLQNLFEGAEKEGIKDKKFEEEEHEDLIKWMPEPEGVFVTSVSIERDALIPYCLFIVEIKSGRTWWSIRVTQKQLVRLYIRLRLENLLGREAFPVPVPWDLFVERIATRRVLDAPIVEKYLQDLLRHPLIRKSKAMQNFLELSPMRADIRYGPSLREGYLHVKVKSHATFYSKRIGSGCSHVIDVLVNIIQYLLLAFSMAFFFVPVATVLFFKAPLVLISGNPRIISTPPAWSDRLDRFINYSAFFIFWLFLFGAVFWAYQFFRDRIFKERRWVVLKPSCLLFFSRKDDLKPTEVLLFDDSMQVRRSTIRQGLMWMPNGLTVDALMGTVEMDAGHLYAVIIQSLCFISSYLFFSLMIEPGLSPFEPAQAAGNAFNMSSYPPPFLFVPTTANPGDTSAQTEPALNFSSCGYFLEARGPTILFVNSEEFRAPVKAIIRKKGSTDETTRWSYTNWHFLFDISPYNVRFESIFQQGEQVIAEEGDYAGFVANIPTVAASIGQNYSSFFIYTEGRPFEVDVPGDHNVFLRGLTSQDTVQSIYQDSRFQPTDQFLCNIPVMIGEYQSSSWSTIWLVCISGALVAVFLTFGISLFLAKVGLCHANSRRDNWLYLLKEVREHSSWKRKNRFKSFAPVRQPRNSEDPHATTSSFKELDKGSSKVLRARFPSKQSTTRIVSKRYPHLSFKISGGEGIDLLSPSEAISFPFHSATSQTVAHSLGGNSSGELRANGHGHSISTPPASFKDLEDKEAQPERRERETDDDGAEGGIAVKEELNGPKVKIFVDAERTFSAMYAALVAAEEQILIAGWWICPDVHLVRKPHLFGDSKLDNLLLKKAEEGVEIYILMYKEVALALTLNSAYTKRRLMQHQNIHIIRHPEDFQLLDLGFWSHHEKILCVDQRVAFVGGLDLCFGRWDTPDHRLVDSEQPYTWPGKDYSNPRVKDFVELDKPYEDLVDRKSVPRMPWHDVHCGVFGLPAQDIGRHFVLRWNYICMGVRYDLKTGLCRCFRRRRLRRVEKCLIPYDYQNISDSTSSEDFARSFVEEQGPTSAPQSGAPSILENNKPSKVKTQDVVKVPSSSAMLQQPLPPRLSAHEGIERLLTEKWLRTASAVTEDNWVDAQCQVIRSLSKWSGGIRTEASIQNAYIKLIHGAKSFIYIENQFFVSGLQGTFDVKNRVLQALVERITEAIEKGEIFRVIVVMPLLPAFEGEVDGGQASTLHAVMHWQYQTICRGGQSLWEKVAELTSSPESYVAFFGLRTYDTLPNGEFVTEQIYVHSKCMIVDDRKVLIGSANINDRSLNGHRDSEIAVVIEDVNFIEGFLAGKPAALGVTAHQLRLSLFREHLGIQEDNDEKIRQILDPAADECWGYINARAKKNTDIYEAVFHPFPSDRVKTFNDIRGYELDEVFENQRHNRLRMQRWSQDNLNEDDPPSWCDIAGRPVTGHAFDLSGWVVAKPSEEETLPTDEEGWVYAFSFSTLNLPIHERPIWTGTALKPIAAVRRRRWVRAERLSGSEVLITPRNSGPNIHKPGPDAMSALHRLVNEEEREDRIAGRKDTIEIITPRQDSPSSSFPPEGSQRRGRKDSSAFWIEGMLDLAKSQAQSLLSSTAAAGTQIMQRLDKKAEENPSSNSPPMRLEDANKLNQINTLTRVPKGGGGVPTEDYLAGMDLIAGDKEEEEEEDEDKEYDISGIILDTLQTMKERKGPDEGTLAPPPDGSAERVIPREKGVPSSGSSPILPTPVAEEEKRASFSPACPPSSFVDAKLVDTVTSPTALNYLAEMDQWNRGIIMKRLSKIEGNLVKFPLQFLVNENLKPSMLPKDLHI